MLLHTQAQLIQVKQKCMRLKTNPHPHPYTVECAEYVTLYVCVNMWLNTDVACARHVSEQQNGHIDLLMCAAVPCHMLGPGKRSAITLAIICSLV